MCIGLAWGGGTSNNSFLFLSFLRVFRKRVNLEGEEDRDASPDPGVMSEDVLRFPFFGLGFWTFSSAGAVVNGTAADGEAGIVWFCILVWLLFVGVDADADAAGGGGGGASVGFVEQFPILRDFLRNVWNTIVKNIYMY